MLFHDVVSAQLDFPETQEQNKTYEHDRNPFLYEDGSLLSAFEQYQINHLHIKHLHSSKMAPLD